MRYTPVGEVIQSVPSVHQEKEDKRVEISRRYILRGESRVGLLLDPYDRALALVMDPVLVYSAAERESIGVFRLLGRTQTHPRAACIESRPAQVDLEPRRVVH